MKRLLQHRWIPYLGLLLVTIVGLFPVVSLHHSMGNDILDAFLPARYFVSEAYRQGFIPLWDPYQFYGVPIYGDLVSVWNPEVWILSFFSLINNCILQELYVFYVFLAGVGMYRLMLSFETDKQAAFLAGTVYMFSGFFIGNAQNIAAISAAAWIPFVILSYKRFSESPTWPRLFPLVFFLYLLIFNGYPGITIITGYLLATLFTVKSILLFRQPSSDKQSWFGQHLFLGIILAILVLPLLVSYIHVKPYIGQMGGVSLSYALMHPFSPQSALSFLYPLSVLKDKVFFTTDTTMTNAYIGIFTLIIFLLAIKHTKGYFLWSILGFGFFALLASFGDYLPIRSFLYTYFPLMNVSRYPSFFRLFFIFSVILIGFRYYTRITETHQQKIRYVGIGLFVISVAIIVWYFSLEHLHTIGSTFVKYPYDEAIRHLHFSEALLLEAFIQSGLLALFLLAIWRKPQHLKSLLSGFIVLDMLIQITLTAPITVYNKLKPCPIAEHLETMPIGYPLPDASHLINHTDKAGQFFPIWRNTATYHKWVSPYGFGSFQMNQYMLATDSFPHLMARIFDHPTAYFSTNIKPLSTLNKVDTSYLPSVLFLEDSVVEHYDSLIAIDSLATIRFSRFLPNEIVLTTHSTTNQFLVLQQNWYDRRKAFIDKTEVPIYRGNLLQTVIFVPKGTHHITFEIQDSAVIWAFYISLLMLFGAFIFYIVAYKRHWFNTRIKQFSIIGIILLILIVAYHSHFSHLEKYNGNPKVVKLILERFVNEHPNDSMLLYVSLLDTARWQDSFGKYPVSIRSMNRFTSTSEFAFDLVQASSHYHFFGFYFNRHSSSDLVNVFSRFFSSPPQEIDDTYWSFQYFDIRKKAKLQAYPHRCFNDMEQDYPFASKPHRDTLRSVSGHFSNKIYPEYPYSSAFHCKIADLPKGSFTIEASAFIHFSENAKAHFVVSINTPDSSYLWQAKDIFKTESYPWQLVSYTTTITGNFPPNAELKVYVWNPHPAPVWIDDFELRINLSST